MRPAIVSGVLTEAAPVNYWPFFLVQKVTVPEVFEQICSAQFPSRF